MFVIELFFCDCLCMTDGTGKKKNRIAIQSIQRYAKLPPLPIIPILSKSDFTLQLRC